MPNKTWTLTVEEDVDTGDAVIAFPQEVLEAAGWQEGDVISWDMQPDGTAVLTKKQQ